MGLKSLSKRERSRVVTGPDPGYEIWKTPEYNVTSGWAPLPHRDTQFHDTWSALTEVQRTTLIHTMMHTHGYSEDTARRHFAGSAATEDDGSVLSGARPMLMATPVASLSEPVWMGHLPHPG